MRYPTPDKMCYFTGAGKNRRSRGEEEKRRRARREGWGEKRREREV